MLGVASQLPAQPCPATATAGGCARRRLGLTVAVGRAPSAAQVEVAAEELGLKLVKTGEGDVSLAH